MHREAARRRGERDVPTARACAFSATPVATMPVSRCAPCGRACACAASERNHSPVFTTLVRFRDARGRLRDQGVGGVGRRGRALRDQFLRVEFAHGRMRLDALVHAGLRVCRLVRLVVSEAAIADQIDDDVVTEAAPEIDREMDGRDTRVDVVRVDVHDRHVEAFREIRGVARRTAVLGIGREADSDCSR